MARPDDNTPKVGSAARCTSVARQAVWAVLLVFGAGVLSGCGGASVAVPTDFPIPVVEKLPLKMGVHLTPELLSYVHAEKLESAGDWSIDLGGAQLSMFQNLLTGMFDHMELVPDPQSPPAGLDGLLIPSIEEVQFSIPSQTRSDYYEVWIRYQFKLFNGDGELLADWPLTAYGKANQRNYGMQTDQPGLQAAALAACRDAMAFFTVQFHGVPPIKDWLAAEL